MIGRLRHSSIWTAIFWLSSLTVLGLTRVPHNAWGDVFDPADRYAGQIHLHQRLFDADLPAPVPLDDRALEGQVAQLRYLERHFARLGLQLAFVVPGAAVDPFGGMLVALGSAEMIRFSIQKGVQRLFHGRYDDLVEVVLDQDLR